VLTATCYAYVSSVVCFVHLVWVVHARKRLAADFTHALRAPNAQHAALATPRRSTQGHELPRAQDFEALTPNLLARTMETVEGGGIVVLLLSTLRSLTQLFTLSMDVHARLRTESHQEVTGAAPCGALRPRAGRTHQDARCRAPLFHSWTAWLC